MHSLRTQAMFALKIDCGYILNRKNKKIVYPCIPLFYNIKWRLRGYTCHGHVNVMIYRAVSYRAVSTFLIIIEIYLCFHNMQETDLKFSLKYTQFI